MMLSSNRRRFQFSFVHIVMLTIITVVTLGSIGYTGHLWEFEYVDTPKNFDDMSHRSIATDSEGNLYIAYGGENLYLTTFDGTDWHYQTIDDTPAVGRYASLALDSDGHPHISYFDALNGSLRYANYDGTTWWIQTIPTEAGIGEHNALALDSSDFPHVAFHDGATQSMVYAFWNGESWEFETFNDSKGCHISIALDVQDQPHICYQNTDYPWLGLTYCFRDESGWHLEGLPSGGSLGGPSNPNSLVLDSSGSPHIAYHFLDGCTAGYLIYASRDSSGWGTDTLDTENFAGRSSSLALDVKGNPHVCYSSGFHEDELRYVYRDDDGWHIQRIDSVGCESVSICIDADGGVNTSYLTYHSLKYAYRIESNWQTETIDIKGSAGRYTSIKVDSEDNAHISYSYLSTVKYASMNRDSWHFDIVDDDVYQLSCTSLQLDSSGYPHIAYAPWLKLRYAFFSGNTWQIETVDSEHTGYNASLALNNDNQPHIAYQYLGLRYVYKHDNQWHQEIVDSSHVGDLSLDLDQYGFPRISYYFDTGEMLKYVFKDDSGWHSDIVDSSGNAGEENCLVIDEFGHPHVIYCKGNKTTVVYARHDGISWTYDQVEHDLSRYFSSITFSLDERNHPHTTYSSILPSCGRILKYAFSNGSQWYIEVVDSTQNSVGAYSSLALDSSGMPHISYYDNTVGDLKYAYSAGIYTEIRPITTPSQLFIDCIGPQPCLGNSRFLLHVPETTQVDLSVYNMIGRRIKTIHHGTLSQGSHQIAWDGFDETKHEVPSGTYFIFAGTEFEHISNRIVLIR